MIEFDKHDLPTLALAVSDLLNRVDLMSRLAVAPTLYLEFPSVGLMYAVHQAILRTGSPMHPMNSTFIDDHTIRFDPFAGVSIVLSCKQRFVTEMRGSIAYRDIAFVDFDQAKRGVPHDMVVENGLPLKRENKT